ncbi:CAP domain-containing protein [Vallitalea okinawensis]|uniref:CAP domain-containing protein n=1 Tax=Vallitalea okinawensis TaxID=2078660 RepID=UPI000CFB8E8F|nr:CAP domain-containing protein [Vallitalea okinawensis]
MKRKIFSLTLVISLIFSVACTGQQQEPVKGVESSVSETGDVKTVKVTSNTANVRTGCSADAPVAQTSNKDATLNVVNQVEDWYAVKLPDNTIGFVSANECKPIVAETGQAAGQGGQGTDAGTAGQGGQGADAGTAGQGAGGATPGTNGEGAGDKGTTPETPNNGQNDGAETPDANTDNGTLTDQEQEMLRLVNEARSQNGLQPLKADMELTNVARIKSQDMIDNNYFSHNSPTYGSPFDMMKDFGISYVKAAENIAGNQNSTSAHDALMNSPGHRKNILDPDMTHIGIGIQQGGQYGNMFTQMFVSRPQ